MEPTDSAEIIETIADSLEQNPQQVWQINISVTGMQISSPTTICPTIRGGGIGVNIAPAIYLRPLEQQATKISEEIHQKVREATATLKDLAVELRYSSPSNKMVLTKSMSIAGSVLNQALKTVIDSLVTRSLQHLGQRAYAH